MTSVGLQLWTVRNELDDLDAVLDRVARSGVTIIEPFGLGDPGVPASERIASAKALSRSAARAGLEIHSTHTRLPSLDQLDPFLEEMNALGVTTALAAVPESLAGFDRDGLSSFDSIERYAETFNALSEATMANGLRVGYHNHHWEWERIDSEGLAYDLFTDRLSPDVVIELDVLWASYAGQDPVEIIERLGDRVRYLHIGDASPVTNDAHQVPAGQGDVALEAIFDASDHIEAVFIEASAPPPNMTALELVEASAEWVGGKLEERHQ